MDECNTWGDYFYMEALTRLARGLGAVLVLIEYVIEYIIEYPVKMMRGQNEFYMIRLPFYGSFGPE